MADLNLTDMQTELNTIAEAVKERIYGLENELRLDNSDEEKANLSALRATYVEWASVVDTLLRGAIRLGELGYPVFPTMEVPDSMIATLATELRQSQVASSLFHAAPPATHIETTFTVSDQP